MSRKTNSSSNGSSDRREYKYNERRPEPPEHRAPESQAFSLYDYPGAAARMLLERAAGSLGGIHLENLRSLGIDARDIIKYRPQIRDALLAILREGPSANEGRVRESAVAYLGALEFNDVTEVLAGLITSPAETAEVRGLVAETLCRLGGEPARVALRSALVDPHPLVRERTARALGLIGIPEDGERLAERARYDSDSEVRLQAAAMAQRLLPKSLQQLVPQLERAQPVEAPKLIADTNIVRPIGRHIGAAPQTGPIDADAEQKTGMAGGRDLIRERRTQLSLSGLRAGVARYEIVQDAPEGYVRLRLVGATIPPSSCSSTEGRLFYLSSEEALVDLPAERLPAPGHSLPLCSLGLQSKHLEPTWVPQAPASPTILELNADRPAIWSGAEFAIRVRFWVPSEQQAILLRLETRLPFGSWSTATFVISKEEHQRGEKVVGAYMAAIPGAIDIRATVYSDRGGAGKAEVQLNALPTNPISMTVVPQTVGTNGEGPAHYNAAEDRFYCYARFDVANGFPFSVTLGPTVTCHVTDGGDDVATFSFSIGTSTILANSVTSLYVYTRHGSSSDVYDIFENFGDVRMDFTLQTSAGDISNWHVWAAMAQIKLALNFVGNMSVNTRATFQDIVENEASAIYEQQSLYISESQRFLLPSDHPDWNRYRDIRMNDNKDQDCTSGSDEADDLRDDWSAPVAWLDVWVVESFSGPACSASVGGFSPVDGPTDKGGDESGVVIQLAGVNLSTTFGRGLMGIIVAHEVGHFLGLAHVDDASNFMAASTGGTNTGITHGQYLDMSEHGFVERFVPA